MKSSPKRSRLRRYLSSRAGADELLHSQTLRNDFWVLHKHIELGKKSRDHPDTPHRSRPALGVPKRPKSGSGRQKNHRNFDSVSGPDSTHCDASKTI